LLLEIGAAKSGCGYNGVLLQLDAAKTSCG
jgi:hypothetical protein